MKRGLNRLALSAQQEINILGIDTKIFSITIISAYRFRTVFRGRFYYKNKHLILLDKQESEPDNEVDTLPEGSYDFDNAYAQYLNDVDEGYYDNDDEDEEYFGLSM